jgi:GLPGLI family protein
MKKMMKRRNSIFLQLKGKKSFVAVAALALTIGVQAQDDGLDDIMAAMNAAKIHQDSIDKSSLVTVYDYECHTQDADGNAVTDKMKVCVQVGQRCTRSFPYRKFCMEREWASGKNTDMRSRVGKDGSLVFMDGYDFIELDELPRFRAESYCFVPEVWTNYPEGKTIVRDAIIPNIYETQEERKPISWVLNDDTLTIDGYLCKTATCRLHGRKWKVSYCEDIPTKAGPWKLCGLPGLIIQAESDDGIHRFMLASQQRIASPIYYEHSAITTNIAEEKLIKMRIKIFGNKLYPKNPTYYITDRASMKADETFCQMGDELLVLVNGVLEDNRAHVYQPLELE